jgi:hypothetical protein
MPRGMTVPRRPYVEGVEILAASTEMVLLDGEGWGDSTIRLRWREEWVDVWQRWREAILPKVIAHRPGTRPFAAYVAGEIPEREVLVEPPLSVNWFRLYVPARDGSGSWHYRYPCPYQRPEVEHLRELGIVDDDEYRRHREWLRTRSTASGSRYRDSYPFEQGSYR